MADVSRSSMDIVRETYMKNHHKFILPEYSAANPEDNIQLAASIAANFAEIGFVMNKESIETLAKAESESILDFYQFYLPVLKDMVGDHGEFKTFYQNIPEDLMERDRIDIFLDQVIYGLSGFEIEPNMYTEAKQAFPLLFKNQQQKHIIEEGSIEDLTNEMKLLLESPIAWSRTQREEVQTYYQHVHNVGKELYRLDFKPKNMKNHENKVMFACIVDDVNKAKGKGFFQPMHFLSGDVNDVLRYAAVQSAYNDYLKKRGNIAEISDNADRFGYSRDREFDKEYFYKYASLRWDKGKDPSFTVSRQDAKTIMKSVQNLVDKYGMDQVAGQVFNKKKDWKHLIKHLRLSEFKDTSMNTAYQMLYAISQNANIDRYEQRIEEAIKRNDLTTVLNEAETKPGDFARRFDKIYRMAQQEGREAEVFERFGKVAHTAGISTIIGAYTNFKNRTEEEEMRVFRIASSNKTFSTKDKNREPVNKEHLGLMHDACMTAMQKSFLGKEGMGDVYISDQMVNYKAPADIREMNGALEAYAPGSKVDLGQKQTSRIYVRWTNMKDERLDIDLSATCYDKNGQRMGHIAWNGAYFSRDGRTNHSYTVRGKDVAIDGKLALCYSGDEQDGDRFKGKNAKKFGTAEFIDINRQMLKDNDVKYVVVNVTSFIGIPFSEQPNTIFGEMERDPKEMGQKYEPSTVTNSMKLKSNTTSVVPMIIDIENNQMIAVDIPMHGTVASQHLDEVERILYSVEHTNTLNLKELIEANVKATSMRTYNIENADTIFITPRELNAYKEEHPDVDLSDKKIVYPYDLGYIGGYLLKQEQENELTHIRTAAHDYRIDMTHLDSSQMSEKDNEEVVEQYTKEAMRRGVSKEVILEEIMPKLEFDNKELLNKIDLNQIVNTVEKEMFSENMHDIVDKDHNFSTHEDEMVHSMEDN